MMEKKIAGLLGAVAALSTLAGAQASPAPSDALKASTYADLLQPIPNAARTLQALEEQAAAEPAEANIQVLLHKRYGLKLRKPPEVSCFAAGSNAGSFRFDTHAGR